jgi:mRNA interferase MazF
VIYGDIHWANLPDRGGRVQHGRRPVVIWQDTARFSLPTVLVIPFTTNLATLNKYGGTVFVQPTPNNGLSHPSVALVFQLGALDARWIEDRIGQLDDPDLIVLQSAAKTLQLLP